MQDQRMTESNSIPEILMHSEVNPEGWNNWVDLRPIETLVDGDVKLVFDLVECYLDLFPKYLAQLESAIARGQWQLCQETAQMMKPLVVIVQVRTLFDLLHSIESNNNLDQPAADDIYYRLKKAHQTVLRELYATYARLQYELN